MFNLSSLMQPDKKRRKKNKKIPKSKPISSVSKAKAFSKLQSINASSAASGSSGFGDSNLFATSKLYLLYLLLIVRIVLVFTPQYGYIQPDEFFQSTEPIAGDVFGVETLRVWEFNSTFPMRSMFFPQLICQPAFQLLKLLIDANISNRIFSYFLLVGPRLLITLFSFLIDYSLYRVCRLICNSQSQHSGSNNGRSPPVVNSGQIIDYQLIHSSCYLCFTYYTHTFSNTVETILFALLLATIFESRFSSRIKCHQLSFISSHFHIALLMALGFFNRPTFALFAFVPVLYWLTTYSARSFASASNQTESNSIALLLINLIVNSVKILIYFSIVSLFLITVDTIYHCGFDQLSWSSSSDDNISSTLDYQDLFKSPDNVWKFVNNLFSIVQKRFTLTPVNFLIYNLQSKNLANHGLHPFYFHLLVNFPLMFTLIGFFFYLDLFKFVTSRILRITSSSSNDSCSTEEDTDALSTNITINEKNQNSNSIGTVLFVTLAVSLFGFSFIPHQEPRFLLPLIVPLCLLYASRLFSYVQNVQFIFAIWIGINLVLVIFFGYIHQAGVVRSLFYIKSSVLDNPDSFLPPSFIPLPPSINESLQTNQNETSNYIEPNAVSVGYIDLIFCNMYLPPRHLLMVAKEQPNSHLNHPKINIHDLSILEFRPSFESTLKSIFSANDPTARLILLTIPGALNSQLDKFVEDQPILFQKEYRLSVELISQQFPHFTFEDISHSIAMIVDREKQTNRTSSITSSLYQAFSMNIWKINLSLPN